MIIVDVFVPALARKYNCNLNEKTKIGSLIEELTELICKKEHSVLDGSQQYFMLGSVDKAICFSPDYSLENYSTKNGEKLILL